VTHVQATILDWEIGVLAGIALVRFIVGFVRK
jgi:hypothetical protein